MALGDSYTTPVKSQDRDVILSSGSIAIGAAGAPTLTGSAGLSVTGPGGGGTYVIAFAGKNSPRAHLFAFMAVTATIKGIVGTAFSATTGTATLETQDAAGAPLTPANGDIIHFLLYGMPSSAT